MPADPPPAAPETIDAMVDAAQGGSQRAWEALVKHYWRKVFNVAYKFVGRHDEAEDLTQDIFFKIFRALHTFDRRANFQTWLISISRNFCIDHYRSVRKERELVDRSMDAADVSPVALTVDPTVRLEQADRRALLRKAMAELPDTLRTAVLLRDIQELAYQEIAARLKLPEGTVKSRINRGRRELARQIVRLEEEQHRTLAAARQSAGSSGVGQ